MAQKTSAEISQELWGQYTALLVQQMGAGSSATIQVLPSAQLLFPVIDANGRKDYTPAIQKFADIIPQWGAAYTPSDSSVIDAYQLVLTQMKETATNGSSIVAEYEAENKKLAQMMSKAGSFKTGKFDAYDKDASAYTKHGLQAPSFDAWFADNGLQEYQALVDQQTQQADRVRQLLVAEGISSPLVEALANLNTQLAKGASNFAQPLSINPLPDFLGSWAANPTNKTTITLSQNSSEHDFSSTVWQSQSGTKLFGFISVNSRSESGSSSSEFNSSEKYTIEMDFAATASFTLEQESWFNGALLKEYKSGPWISGSQFDTAKAHPYGDADAVFPLMVTRIYVVMNPKITITLESSESTTLRNTLQQNFANGVNLGSFAFGGSESSTSKISSTQSASGNSSSIIIEDTSNVPQIIAVVNELMP